MPLPIFPVGDDCVPRDSLDALRSRVQAAEMITMATDEEEARPRVGRAASEPDWLARRFVRARGRVCKTVQRLKTSGHERELWSESVTEAQCVDCRTALSRMRNSFDSYAQP